MYCKKCGKLIDDDSVFCAYCGKNLAKATESPEDNEKAKINSDAENENPQAAAAFEAATESEEEEGCSTWILWLLIPFIAVFLAIIVIAASNSGGCMGVFERDLKSSDYICTASQGLTTYNIIITAKREIKSCDVELSLYNSSGEVIFSDTISKSDLNKGSSYAYTFDFGFLNSLTGIKVKYKITGRCR